LWAHVLHEYPAFLIAHASYGRPDCRGVLWPAPRQSGLIDFICSDCAAIVCSVPGADVPEAIELILESATSVATLCPYCSETGVFSRGAELFAYVCRHCGKGVGFGDGEQLLI
jgi:hypothetical protein